MELLQGVLGSLRPAVVAMIASAGILIMISAFWGSAPAISFEETKWSMVVIFILCVISLRKTKINPVWGMVGARVNGRQVPFDYHLQNGDRVEIITSQNSKGPSRDWLGIVKSAQARSKINQWFKRQFKEENIVRGKELLEKYCKSKSIRLPELMKPEYIKKVELKYGFKDWDSVCAAVGHGGLKEGQVINKMQEEDRKIQKQKITDEQILQKTTEAAQAAAANPEKKKEEKSKGGIVVRGANDVAVRFSKCCNPVPGDEIVGFITRGRGISIHRTDCVNLLNMPES